MSKVLTGAFIGLAAGFAAGLLLAPEAGEDTREKIKDTARTWQRKAKNVLGNTADDLSHLKDVFSKQIAGLQDDVRERVLNILSEGQDTADDIRRNVKS
ncbi:Gas vesicle protein [Chitinophaga costaii]|uniref:Gas vesicle protein n=1 Tax=Chitinophaga costaii TaxID=1335309 RepID=A0A1C4G3F7_9BACT|nr:YtxH domain-containing protein [Chitinophaga costaii]PUZ20979.1 YtxH domain-containing protein [Chitinophaga costaii]SCC62738.1 Gas vesicle protein [Chitinophaga costaii]